MAQVTITQLPQAQALTGNESVPIVQNGVTVQTTTGAIAVQPTQTQTFLTATQQTSLPNSRYLAVGDGLDITDGGAQGTLEITMTGAAASLNTNANGIQVKTGISTLTTRAIDVGTGLEITNGDAIAGDPLIELGAFLANFQSLSGSTGLVGVSGGALNARSIVGTSNQTTVTNGDASSGNPTVGFADNAVFPGTGSITVPNGTTIERVSNLGSIRYNTSSQVFEGYSNTGWNAFSVAGGVTSFSAGTTGFTPSTDTAGAVTLAGVLVGANGGTGIDNGTKTITLGGDLETSGAYDVVLTSTAATNVTLPTTGTLATRAGVETLTNKTMSGASNTFANIPNIALDNYTISGIPLGSTLNALTIGTGLSGTSYDGSTITTIAIDSTVVTLTGTQTLTNKSISGSANTLTNIPNSALTNSAVTVGTTAISLGASSLTLGGLTSVAVTQNPTTDFQLATKQYVDNLVAVGTTYHTPVYVESPDSTGNLNATYNNGTAGVGATLTNAGTQVALTVDGVLMTTGKRVLVYNQTNQAENGVYTVTVVGDGSTNWVLTRATDADSFGAGADALDEGSTFFVQAGATGAGETYTCTTSGTIVFGTTAITFAQIGSTQVYSAGTGITLTGTQFSLTSPVLSTLGGTGLASYTSGDMVYYSTGTALSKLGIGSNTYIMTSSGAAPQWSDPTGITVGNATNATNSTNATNATNTAITADATNATNYLTFVSATTGNLPQLVNSGITCNPSTGQITGGVAGGAF